VNTFVVEKFERFSLVTFYTVRWDEAELSETDKFISKYQSVIETQRDFQEILALIEDIGAYRGAKDLFFRRHAGKAQELPPLTAFEIQYFHNNLRLFCIKINDNIVILFNGGKKTSQTSQDSPALNMPFLEAQTFAAKIFKALHDKDILVNESTHSLVSAYGDDEILVS
jgi:hypothetical protein